MKKFITLICLNLFNSFICFSQNKVIDSLENLLKAAKEDTTKSNTLNILSREFQRSGMLESAMNAAQNAIALSEKINFFTGLINGYNNWGAIFHLQGNDEKALSSFSKSLQICKQIEDKMGEAISYNNMGLIHYYQSNYEKALENYFQALKIRKEIVDKKGIASCHNNIGLVYYNLGDYKKSLQSHLEALHIREQLGDQFGAAFSYNNVGMIYYYQGNYEKALENYLASLKINEQIGNKREIAQTYNNIGVLYLNQGNEANSKNNTQLASENYEKALKYYSLSLKIQEQINDKLGIAANYSNVGNIYFNQRKFDKSLESFTAAKKIYEELGDKENMALSYKNSGEVLISLKKYANAEMYLNKALDLDKSIGAKNGQKDDYYFLAKLWDAKGDYKKAHQSLQLYAILKDTLLNIGKNKQITEMQTKYETEKKEKEIVLLKKEKEVQQLKLKQSRIQIYSLLASLFFVVVVSYLLYNRYKLKQKEKFNKELLKQQQLRMKAVIETQEAERKRIAEDLHDGVGQLLAGLKIKLNGLDEEAVKLSENKKEKFFHSKTVLDDACNEVRTIAHQMMPKALSQSGIVAALNDLVNKTFSNSSIKCTFDSQNVPENLPQNISINIYRIVQELLGNIIKHSKASEVSVNLFKNKEQLILLVEDNGIGIKSENGKPKGMGMANITGRVELMNGNFVIENAPVKGTVASIRIPLTI